MVTPIDVDEVSQQDYLVSVNSMLSRGWVLLAVAIAREVCEKDGQKYVREVPQYVLGRPREAN